MDCGKAIRITARTLASHYAHLFMFARIFEEIHGLQLGAIQDEQLVQVLHVVSGARQRHRLFEQIHGLVHLAHHAAVLRVLVDHLDGVRLEGQCLLVELVCLLQHILGLQHLCLACRLHGEDGHGLVDQDGRPHEEGRAVVGDGVGPTGRALYQHQRGVRVSLVVQQLGLHQQHGLVARVQHLGLRDAVLRALVVRLRGRLPHHGLALRQDMNRADQRGYRGRAPGHRHRPEGYGERDGCVHVRHGVHDGVGGVLALVVARDEHAHAVQQRPRLHDAQQSLLARHTCQLDFCLRALPCRLLLLCQGGFDGNEGLQGDLVLVHGHRHVPLLQVHVGQLQSSV
mmetsp:Transcript_18766/g.41790  ORF Transcript_18766/g.41790 Transcript_18766/m.41790 type:complete len:341 (-) Transcript_18766:1259-2281(-)